MECVEDVVIVGAGLAGLATALGLHRKGIRSLVLESADSLRASGFALTIWTNAWRALDALGVADSLRQNHIRLQRSTVISTASGALTSEVSYTSQGSFGKHEARCVNREVLLQTFSKELPKGTIRYSSKVVSIEESAGNIKLLHLADGSILKTKVLIGCDGVNSVIARWLGFKKPIFAGRTAARGLTTYPDGHGRNRDLAQYIGHGFRFGFIPCDDKNIYWYITWTRCEQEDKEMEGDPKKMKQHVLNKLRMSAKVPEDVLQIVEESDMGTVASSPLKFRSPFDMLWGNISKGNVCVAGDALHPMTPDLGQGGCSAIECSVILARCLGDAFLEANGKYAGIKKGLEKYAGERRWRSFKLIAIAYTWGKIQERDGTIMRYVRDELLAQMMANVYLKSADFDCGEL